MIYCDPPWSREYTALYRVTSVAKPVYRKTTPVVVRNNYCNARLQGVFYARPVNSPRNMHSAPNHDIGIRLIVGDELFVWIIFIIYYPIVGTRKNARRSVILDISNRSLYYVMQSTICDYVEKNYARCTEWWDFSINKNSKLLKEWKMLCNLCTKFFLSRSCGKSVDKS